MTLKRLMQIICLVVIVCAVVAMAVFALGGSQETTQAAELIGTWKVAAAIKDGQAAIAQDEYMVFSEDRAVDYRGGEAYMASAYTLDASGNIKLTDISKSYHVVRETDNFYCLYENDHTYIELIRCGDAGMNMPTLEPADIEGKWSIVYRRTDKPYQGNYLIFEDGTLSQYSAASNGVDQTAPYAWLDGGMLSVEAMGKEMAVYPVAEKGLILLELTGDVGFIWELERAQ